MIVCTTLGSAPATASHAPQWVAQWVAQWVEVDPFGVVVPGE